MTNMERLEAIVAQLPEAERVDIEKWGDHPTFRVRGKNFVFSSRDATSMSLKLPKDEAKVVVASAWEARPAGYGLGRHGWIALELAPDAGDDVWSQVEDWVRTSYMMVAPKKLARQVAAATAV